MKIILLKDIPKIGRKGEVKEISEGHAMNFIIPRGLGVKATPAEIKKIEAQKSTLDTERKIQEELLEKSIASLGAITVTISEKANEKGHLFEGIKKDMLVKEIEKVSGIKLDPDYIDLEKPIKEVGEFLVPIEALGKKGKVKVVVEGK